MGRKVNEEYWVTLPYYEHELKSGTDEAVERLSTGEELTTEDLLKTMRFIRFSEEMIKAFCAMVSRKLFEKGLLLVTCPHIDMRCSDTMNITIDTHIYKAVPIYVPKERGYEYE